MNKVYLLDFRLSPMSITTKQIIKKQPIGIAPNKSIREAASLMAKENIGLLVILDGNKVIGVVSERDVMKAVASGANLDDPVISIASKRVITINEDENIYKAAELMHGNNVRHLVVMGRDGSLRGVISIRDVVGETVRLRTLAESTVPNQEEPSPHTD